MSTTKLQSGATFPQLQCPTLDNQTVTLGEPQKNTSQDSEHTLDWQLLVVYRGQHCPLCTRYLKELETLKDKFFALGVDVLAVSADSEAQAKKYVQDIEVSFPVAYGLSIEQMQTLGLYISEPRSPKETDHPFAEPALFVINDKKQIHVIDISNAPFARPDLKTLLSGLEFVRNPDNNYPIRGTYDS